MAPPDVNYTTRNEERGTIVLHAIYNVPAASNKGVFKSFGLQLLTEKITIPILIDRHTESVL